MSEKWNWERDEKLDFDEYKGILDHELEKFINNATWSNHWGKESKMKCSCNSCMLERLIKGKPVLL